MEQRAVHMSRLEKGNEARYSAGHHGMSDTLVQEQGQRRGFVVRDLANVAGHYVMKRIAAVPTGAVVNNVVVSLELDACFGSGRGELGTYEFDCDTMCLQYTNGNIGMDACYETAEILYIDVDLIKKIKKRYRTKFHCI